MSEPFVVAGLKMMEDPYNANAIHYGFRKPGWVKIRPCAEKYENKTYLGIYIGDVAQGFTTKYHPEDQTLSVGFSYFNPGIFVPALGEVIYGNASWWGNLKTPEDLKDIEDLDIDSVWYVQALKALTSEGPTDETV